MLSLEKFLFPSQECSLSREWYVPYTVGKMISLHIIYCKAEQAQEFSSQITQHQLSQTWGRVGIGGTVVCVKGKIFVLRQIH